VGFERDASYGRRVKQLRFVGPGDDGAVILESMDGEKQFRLPIDDTLLGALRLEPMSEPVTVPSESGDQSMTELRPRDIQMRVRAGEDPKDLAEEAGTSLDRVMRFAYPVLQERVRVVDEARRSRARGGGDGHTGPFGELFDARLVALGTEPTSVSWDAYRRPDGGWTITAAFTARETDLTAKFSFVLTNRSVSALNDVASDLLSGHPIGALQKPQPGQPSETEPIEPPPEWDGPRLAAVPDSLDTAEMPAVPPPEPDSSSSASAPSERQRAEREHERRSPLRLPGRRQKAHTHPIPVSVDDEMVDELFDQDAFAPAGGRWQEQPLPLDLGQGEQSGTNRTANPASVAAADATAAGHHLDGEDPEHPHRRTGKSGDKPRMPSWDDILLGVRRKSE
jgi:DUF3071 family protein